MFNTLPLFYVGILHVHYVGWLKLYSTRTVQVLCKFQQSVRAWFWFPVIIFIIFLCCVETCLECTPILVDVQIWKQPATSDTDAIILSQCRDCVATCPIHVVCFTPPGKNAAKAGGYGVPLFSLLPELLSVIFLFLWTDCLSVILYAFVFCRLCSTLHVSIFIEWNGNKCTS